MEYFKFYMPAMTIMGYTDLSFDDLLAELQKNSHDFLEVKNACQMQISNDPSLSEEDRIVVVPQTPPDVPLRVRKSSIISIAPLNEAGSKMIENGFAKLKEGKSNLKIFNKPSGLVIPGIKINGF